MGVKNLDLFNGELATFAKVTVPQAQMRLQKVACLMLLGCAIASDADPGLLVTISGLLHMTRVDTGRARGGYQVSVGSPADGASGAEDYKGETGDPPSSDERERLLAPLADMKPGDALYITNNVEYIEYLNDGTTKFAGDHMQERAIDNTLQALGGAAA
jgi:hypothetical protein